MFHAAAVIFSQAVLLKLQISLGDVRDAFRYLVDPQASKQCRDKKVR